MESDTRELYIEFLNKDKNFQKDTVSFKGNKAWKDAIVWGKSNLENFDEDMIRTLNN